MLTSASKGTEVPSQNPIHTVFYCQEKTLGTEKTQHANGMGTSSGMKQESSANGQNRFKTLSVKRSEKPVHPVKCYVGEGRLEQEELQAELLKTQSTPGSPGTPATRLSIRPDPQRVILRSVLRSLRVCVLNSQAVLCHWEGRVASCPAAAAAVAAWIQVFQTGHSKVTRHRIEHCSEYS